MSDPTIFVTFLKEDGTILESGIECLDVAEQWGTTGVPRLVSRLDDPSVLAKAVPNTDAVITDPYVTTQWVRWGHFPLEPQKNKSFKVAVEELGFLTS
jgi:hypothetical protein